MKSLSKSRKEALKSATQKTINIGVDTLPMFPLDASDRNRTSPFAFTGNKFNPRRRFLPNLCMAHDGAQYHCGGKPG